MISLMEKTGIRIGNEFYEKLYGSFGLTTLKDKHVNIRGGMVKFTFRGKKGVEHQVSFESKKLSRSFINAGKYRVKNCFNTSMKKKRQRQTIESGMVNEYIKEYRGRRIHCKRFSYMVWLGGCIECIKRNWAF